MSEKTNDGGAAFPCAHQRYDHNEGMSLRDWFAGQALGGILAFPWKLKGDETKHPDVVAELAYIMADAMLAEREK